MGVAFGPDLSAFGKSQSKRAIVEAILHPSKSISHGYEGHTVKTGAGDVDGVVLSRGDPVIVQSQGGLLQLIPKPRVKKIERMRRSLMWPPQLLGLDAQGLADLVSRAMGTRATACQIRIGLCKGMLVIDPTLTGVQLLLRPSMIKGASSKACAEIKIKSPSRLLDGVC